MGPSTGNEKTLPNCFALTLIGVRMVSLRFTPVRAFVVLRSCDLGRGERAQESKEAKNVCSEAKVRHSAPVGVKGNVEKVSCGSRCCQGIQSAK